MKDKLKKIYYNDKTLVTFLIVFVIIQPFLDVEILFTDHRYEILGFTIPTLLRTIGIGVLSLLALKNIKRDTEHKIYFWYFVSLFLYTIFHHIVNIDEGVFPGNFYYSILAELFYIVRMIFPFFMVYITKYSKITYEQFSKTISWTSLIIATVIISSNTLKISLTAYPSDSLFNKLNFIEWFNGFSNYSFEVLTSKGWFFSANQLSGLLMLLLPINIYDFLKKDNSLCIISTPLLILAMIIVSTRVSAYGWLLTSVAMVILFIFFKFSIKEELKFKKIIIFIFIVTFFCGILMISPIRSRNYIHENKDADSVNILDSNEHDLNSIYSFIESNYYKFGVREEFIFDLYSYKFDHIFWLDVFSKSRKYAFDNRQMQQLITDRLIQLNSKSLKNSLFGYSFSKFRNGGIYIEHDFKVQYVTMGLFGIILLIGPYLAYIIFCMKKILYNQKHFNFLNITLTMSIVEVLLISTITGHLIDELFVTLFMGFILGFLYKSVTEEVEL